jgi:phage terminase small subunit
MQHRSDTTRRATSLATLPDSTGARAKLCIEVSAPPHLQPNTRRWFAGVTNEYDLEPHHERLLQAAAEAWDRLQEAREALRKDGTYVEGRYGKRAHPAVAVERDSRVAFARLLRELDLDGEPAPDPRPTRLR